MKTDIVQQFMDLGYQIHPDALRLIGDYAGPTEDMVQHIVGSLDEAVFVISPEHITRYIECSGVQSDEPDKESLHVGSSFRVLRDVTGTSTCAGSYDEFIVYFNDRYMKLRGMLEDRISPRAIENVSAGSGQDVSVIGMVSDITTTSKGDKLIRVEDPTGVVPALVLRSKGIFQDADKIMLDQVIGVRGAMTRDKGLMIANNLIWPDVPSSYQPRKAATSSLAVLISDVHVGSNTFLEDAWNQFIKWLNQEIGDDAQKKMASEIEYIVIAGDLVDGIGVYPNQERELTIMDIHEQYMKAAEYLEMIPDDITIIISSGNHDAVRQAEPQPALLHDMTRHFSSDNIHFVGNPALIELNGVWILIYHGRGIEDFVSTIPSVSYEKPQTAMIEMLRCRHLSPTYGNHVSIAPEQEDYLIIDTIPDILLCGHVHTVGVGKYHGVTLVNPGTWQSQTEYQKQKNIQPDPGYAVAVDLKTLNTSLLQFSPA